MRTLLEFDWLLQPSAPPALLLIKTTIILLLALALSAVMSRATAGSRHLLWLVTIVTLLLVPVVATYAPLRMQILPAPVTQSAVAPLPIEVAQVEQERDNAAPTPAQPATPPQAHLQSQARESSALRTWLAARGIGEWLFALWAVVALALMTRLLGATLAVRRIVHHAKALDSADWQMPLVEVSDRLGLDAPPRLLASDTTAMPFACGVLTPTIVLPANCDSWSLDRRYAVLMHEVAHIGRRDLLGHTLGRVTCALYWFHPLVWSAFKRLRAESERACDDLALVSGARASDYAEHLLDIISHVRKDRTPTIALAMARRKEFEGRMLAILDPDIRHSRPNRRQALTLSASIGVMALLVSAATPAPRTASAPAQNVAQQPDRNDLPSLLGDTATTTFQRQSSSTVTAQSEVEARVRATVEAQATTGNRPGMSPFIDSLLFEQAAAQHNSAPGSDDERPALLAKILRSDSSASLRRIAAWGLAQYEHNTVAVDALAAALRRDANKRVREMSAWALGNGGGETPAAVEALMYAARSDAETEVRATAAWALGNSGVNGASDALIAALSDTSAAVRTRAMWALGNVHLRKAPTAVIAALRDKEVSVRRLASWTLYQIEDPAAVPALETAMRAETDKSTQLGYLRALAATGEQSIEAIKRLLDSSDSDVRSMAVRALAGGQAAGPWPWPWPQPRPQP